MELEITDAESLEKAIASLDGFGFVVDRVSFPVIGCLYKTRHSYSKTKNRDGAPVKLLIKINIVYQEPYRSNSVLFTFLAGEKIITHHQLMGSAIRGLRRALETFWEDYELINEQGRKEVEEV